MDAGSRAPCWVYDMPSYTYQRIIVGLVEAKNLLVYFIYPTHNEFWVVEASRGVNCGFGVCFSAKSEYDAYAFMEAREMKKLRLIVVAVLGN